MQYILYFLIAIGATTVGSLTGMGGGVIIKPLMDVMHHFDVETIGVLSSITVFSMSAVSIGKQMLAKTQIPFQIAIPLSLGSVAGGYIGQWMLSAIVSGVSAQGLVTVVQNVLLAVLILCVYPRDRILRHLTLDAFCAQLLQRVGTGEMAAQQQVFSKPSGVALIIDQSELLHARGRLCGRFPVGAAAQLALQLGAGMVAHGQQIQRLFPCSPLFGLLQQSEPFRFAH
mgnify:CR=1 FL=1